MKRAAAILAFAWAVITLCACLRCTPTEDLAGGSSTEGGNVNGVVVHPDRTPVVDARVLLLPQGFTADTTGAADSRVCSTSTASDGSFDIDSIEPGTYAVLVYAKDGGARSGPVWIMEAQTTDLDTLVIASYGGLSGRVEVIYGSPELVSAVVPSTFERVRAEADSTFTVAPLPPGEYTVIVSCPGSIEPPETVTVSVEAGKVHQIPTVFVFHLRYLYGRLTATDTVVVLSGQLPADVSVWLHTPLDSADVPQATWTVNGQPWPPAEQPPRSARLMLTDSMLFADTNMLELSVTYADTVVNRTWTVVRRTSVRYAPALVTGTVLSQAVAAGTQHRLWSVRVDTVAPLDTVLLAYWRRYPECRVFDSGEPAIELTPGQQLCIPAYGDHHEWFASHYPARCGFTVGGSATFILTPDNSFGNRAFRVRTDEHVRDFAHVAMLDTSRVPWLAVQAGAGAPGSAQPILDFGEPHMTPDGLLLERYREDGGALIAQCYRILPDGTPVELRAGLVDTASPVLAYYHFGETATGYAWDSPPQQTVGRSIWVDSAGMMHACTGGDITRHHPLAPASLDTLRSLLDTWTASMAAVPDTAQPEHTGGTRRYLLHQGLGRFVFSTAALGCDASAAFSSIEGFFVAHGMLPSAAPTLMPGTVERYVRVFCRADGSVVYGTDTLIMSYSYNECGTWEVREYFSPGSPMATDLPDTNRFVLRITTDRITVGNHDRPPQVFHQQALSASGIPLRVPDYGPQISMNGWRPDTVLEGIYLEGHTRDIVLGGRPYPVLNVLVDGVDLAHDGCAELLLYSGAASVVRMVHWCRGGLPAPDSYAATGWERVF